jgi:hypothetical protein
MHEMTLLYACACAGTVGNLTLSIIIAGWCLHNDAVADRYIQYSTAVQEAHC